MKDCLPAEALGLRPTRERRMRSTFRLVGRLCAAAITPSSNVPAAASLRISLISSPFAPFVGGKCCGRRCVAASVDRATQLALWCNSRPAAIPTLVHRGVDRAHQCAVAEGLDEEVRDAVWLCLLARQRFVVRRDGDGRRRQPALAQALVVLDEDHEVAATMLGRAAFDGVGRRSLPFGAEPKPDSAAASNAAGAGARRPTHVTGAAIDVATPTTMAAAAQCKACDSGARPPLQRGNKKVTTSRKPQPCGPLSGPSAQ